MEKQQTINSKQKGGDGAGGIGSSRVDAEQYKVKASTMKLANMRRNNCKLI